jgi:predicted DNA binding protein
MYAEIQTGSYFLADTLQNVSETQVSVDNLDATQQIPLRAIVWVDTTDHEKFEFELVEDPTVESYEQLTSANGRYRYSIEYDHDALDIQLYRTLVENEATVYYAARGPGDSGWLVHYTFPDRKRFAAFETTCTDLGVELDINTVAASSEPVTSPSISNKLTENQREAVLTALQGGYFQIPREMTLSDLGTELGITRQAASERLRRGNRRLIRQLILGED